MEICNDLYNKLNNKSLTPNNKFLKFFYNRLRKGEDILEKIKININSIDNGLEKLHNLFIPNDISEYISNYKGNTYKVTGSIFSRNITIFFVCYDNTDSRTILYYTNYVFLLIYLLTHKTTCSKNLKIKIYLTPFKKEVSHDYSKQLTASEVNTGFSNVGCLEYSEITIYRKEEWFKVLIHELFHNLNLDFATVDISDIREKLYELFKLDINYEINESYAEIWARLIIILFSSYIDSNNYKQFYINFKKLITNEIQFSIKQATKVLKYVNNMVKYKEDTHAYVYYVFTSSLMYNYLIFFEWCDIHNDSLFYFKKDKKTVELFTELIISSLENENFNQILICMYNTKLDKSMRMTSLNIL